MRDGDDVGRVDGEGAPGTGDAVPPSAGAPTGAAAAGEADNGPVPPLDRLRLRLERRLGGRPLSAYGVLLAGFVVLLGLLAVIFLTSVGEDDREDGPVCFEAQLDRFREQLYAGEVRRVRVVVPKERREFGVARVRIDYLDGKCADLPQGYAGRDAADQVVGMVTTYNETSELRRVDIAFDVLDVPNPVLLPPSPTPTISPSPTATQPPPTPTAAPPAPTTRPTPTATEAPTGTLPAVVSPEASPGAEWPPGAG